MQNFILNIYENIRSKLCERRNKRPVINRFAAIERTDVLVKKVQEPSVMQNPLDDLRQMRFSSKQAPQVQQQPQPQQSQPQQYPTPVKAKPSTYKLSFDQLQQQQTISQPPRQTLIQSHLSIDSYNSRLQQTYREFKFLQQQDIRRRKNFWKNIYHNYSNQQLDNDISSYIDQGQQNNDTLDARTLKIMYQSDVESIREIKYSRELYDYPEIEFQTYKSIRQLWALGRKNPNYVIKEMKLKFLEKLTARSFRTLSFGTWLNDEIINCYLQMLDIRATETRKPYRVLNSFFAQTTFSKPQQIIKRVLKRKNITQRNTIIIAINNGNHWFFAKISNSKVIVYDSIRKYPNHYLESPNTKTIFENIINFADNFYGSQHSIEVDEAYPQQENSSDCGMFLLCGIKDIVRGYNQWSFSMFDVNYKRVQVAQELLNQTVTSFN